LIFPTIADTVAKAARFRNCTGKKWKAARRKDYPVAMRSFFGGLTLMLGIGFFGWGFIFLLRFPSHGEGRTAVVVGICAILIGLFLMFPGSRDAD